MYKHFRPKKIKEGLILSSIWRWMVQKKNGEREGERRQTMKETQRSNEGIFVLS